MKLSSLWCHQIGYQTKDYDRGNKRKDITSEGGVDWDNIKIHRFY